MEACNFFASFCELVSCQRKNTLLYGYVAFAGQWSLRGGGSKTPLPSADFLNLSDWSNLLQLFLTLNEEGGRKSVVYFLVQRFRIKGGAENLLFNYKIRNFEHAEQL